MADTYDYEVFLSYSRTDKAWATKLADALTAKGIKFFMDAKRLEAGMPWEPQLNEALRKSQHLIVVWSNNAKLSDWVNREMGTFNAIMDPHGSQQISPHRRLIVVTLEGQNTAYTSTQTITDIKDANVYAAGAEAIDIALWQAAMDKAVHAVRIDDTSVPIPVAVLTMTDADLNQLNSAVWNRLTSQLSTTQEALSQHYKPQRIDWRPFGSSHSVREILVKVKAEIEATPTVTAPTIRWEYLSDDFWSDIEVAGQHAATKFRDIALIVIDPIALYHPEVYQRAILLREHCFNNEKCAVMVLPPFSIPQVAVNLRNLLLNRTPLFDSYYMPAVPPKSKSLAQYGMTVSDEVDMKRLLLTTLGYYVMKNQSPEKPAALRI